VTGVRPNAFAKAHPLQVEVEKPEKECGYYIHPEPYGAPEEARRVGASSGNDETSEGMRERRRNCRHVTRSKVPGGQF